MDKNIDSKNLNNMITDLLVHHQLADKDHNTMNQLYIQLGNN